MGIMKFLTSQSESTAVVSCRCTGNEYYDNSLDTFGSFVCIRGLTHDALLYVLVPMYVLRMRTHRLSWLFFLPPAFSTPRARTMAWSQSFPAWKGWNAEY